MTNVALQLSSSTKSTLPLHDKNKIIIRPDEAIPEYIQPIANGYHKEIHKPVEKAVPIHLYLSSAILSKPSKDNERAMLVHRAMPTLST